MTMPLPMNGDWETQKWWTNWYLEHKLGCTEEGAFLGRLYTLGLDRMALTPTQLDAQWSDFQAWWLASTAP
jgi:hypothetical protein